MGRDRKRILIGLAVAMFFGFAVYMRLWTIDYSMSSDESELLRRQFDLANREAMDESAEWRRLYDNQLDIANKCNSELKKLNESFEKVGDATRINQKLKKMQEENIVLREQVDVLKRKLETEKLQCGSQ
ncbi:uncharacterized protein LOC111014949 [Momordica charantia]|uniref:Uncharacterized protein LOC111014949 n=1 Tax=Momordica charantia TaxID=3673 RepID=A0A6J1CUQ1_MOMCH|nr:uncharacterized protein LOC111014949 [Momordica charantia]